MIKKCDLAFFFIDIEAAIKAYNKKNINSIIKQLFNYSAVLTLNTDHHTSKDSFDIILYNEQFDPSFWP